MKRAALLLFGGIVTAFVTSAIIRKAEELRYRSYYPDRVPPMLRWMFK